MPIQFICPNGHPLSAPRKQAGKPGRCPKCEVAYVTPFLEDVQADVAAGPGAMAEDVTVTFEFLCPNGHKIKAAEEVAGQKAKCPECGERFRVPDYSAGASEELPAGGQESGQVDQEPNEIQLAEVRAGWTVPDNILQGDHEMADVLAWIWEQKQPGAAVEVQLRDGGVLEANCYAPALSSITVGVFGVRTEAGQIELLAIQWDAVATARIICEAESVEGLLEE